VSDVLGATPVQPTSCARVTPVVAPGCAPLLSRERRSGPEALELAPERPRCESRRLRLSWPGACCDPLGGCIMAPKQRTHLRCCHAPCEISRRTSGHGPCLSRETGLRPDASACLGRASLGRCGETCTSFGGACEDSADGQRPARASLGRQDADAVQNANVRPSLSREAR